PPVVDRFLHLEDLALHVHGYLLRHFAVLNRRADIGDLSPYTSASARHEIDAVREVLPRARHITHVGLAAQLALGAHLAGDARHLGGEGAKLVHHRVDRVLELQDLALHLDGEDRKSVVYGQRLHDVGHGEDLVRHDDLHE